MKITLCGSTRFKDEFIKQNLKLTLEGHVVYSVAGFGHSGDVFTYEQKLRLDAIHFAKIANSDAIFVINKKGYIGESTRREIYFAEAIGLEIIYLES